MSGKNLRSYALRNEIISSTITYITKKMSRVKYSKNVFILILFYYKYIFSRDIQIQIT